MVALRASKLVWPAMSRIRPRIDSIASTWVDSALVTLTASLGLAAGAGGDVGRDLDFGPGILDRADQAGRGLGGFAHRGGRLFGGGGDFAGLAEHAARRGAGGRGLAAQALALLGAALDDAQHLAVEIVGAARMDFLAFAAGQLDGVMDEAVDFDRLHFGQGAGEARPARLRPDPGGEG